MRLTLIALTMLCTAPLSAQVIRPDHATFTATGKLMSSRGAATPVVKLDVDRNAARTRGALIGGGIGLLLYVALHSDADAGSGSAVAGLVMVGAGALIGAALGSNSAAQTTGAAEPERGASTP